MNEQVKYLLINVYLGVSNRLFMGFLLIKTHKLSFF